MSAANLARSLYRKVADAAERHHRQQLTFAVDPQRAANPTIFFLTPDHPSPSGGIRVIYRQVDILNAAGFDAYVLHHRPGFRCTWFKNETRVTDVAAIELRSDDIVVVPEVDVDLIPNLPEAVRYVIFNQNSHLTWNRASDLARFYLADPRLAAVVTVSIHNTDMLQRAFPACPVRRIHLGIDPSMFHAGQAQRPRRIAYMPRRGRTDARQVIEILRGNGVLDGWEVVALDGISHDEVAAQLRTTRIFLAFTHQEGFGLPAAEAMACGCYVIGNDGFSGREFFHSNFCARVEVGDVLGFVDAVEEAISSEKNDPDWCLDRGRRASEFILDTYSPARERAEVAALYDDILQAQCCEPVAAG
ncbi:Glycosyl transferases group 1 [Mesorhizobium albiziae]|uniref:Glycosyl transferases group 1 n=1 Tax=Neomesorhizobium albiziae TaxID=335020 RepID=A0A1I3XK03_9HYPH|nr:glycosyltransferase [Mesorhizobium albiziae]GLS30380.1 hypothetical protein GCM10007937_20880 [Mesorhizobium albiziae]SFK19835.1 Glycosyl transferases group 1 [Mesorhizobium albiziae]